VRKKKSSLLLKIAMIGLAAYAAVNLLRLQIDVSAREQENDALHVQIERQKRENAIKTDAINAASEEAFVENIARTEMGWVSGGEKVFVDISD